MKIVDNTNDTWKIGDIVIDNDERKGIIKKTKDDAFVIVRIDEKHVGDYFRDESYFFADTLFSKGEKSDLPCFSGALADAEANDFYKNRDGEPAYIIGHMPVIFNTSKIEIVYPMGREISGVEE